MKIEKTDRTIGTRKVDGTVYRQRLKESGEIYYTKEVEVDELDYQVAESKYQKTYNIKYRK